MGSWIWIKFATPTGRVFTGGTIEHVRTPSNRKIKFNKDIVHPTRTCHGHPVWGLYQDKLVKCLKLEAILEANHVPVKNLNYICEEEF